MPADALLLTPVDNDTVPELAPIALDTLTDPLEVVLEPTPLFTDTDAPISDTLAPPDT